MHNAQLATLAKLPAALPANTSICSVTVHPYSHAATVTVRNGKGYEYVSHCIAPNGTVSYIAAGLHTTTAQALEPATKCKHPIMPNTPCGARADYAPGLCSDHALVLRDELYEN